MRSLGAVVLAVLLAACGGESTPSCEQVADHIGDLVKKAGSSLEAAPRETLIANCQSEQKTNAKFRRCVMKTTDLEGAKKCELEAALERMNR